jgi:bacterioferritin-associated ferredoxin
LCVCVYRCVQLKELAVCECQDVTDVGISKVIRNCSQLRVMNLYDLLHVTGMCAVCEDPEPCV